MPPVTYTTRVIDALSEGTAVSSTRYTLCRSICHVPKNDPASTAATTKRAGKNAPEAIRWTWSHRLPNPRPVIASTWRRSLARRSRAHDDRDARLVDAFLAGGHGARPR